MAQDFSIAFYRSLRWKKCRADYIKRVNGICERCGQPGLILHHKILLTPDNIDNPEITLNHDNLEYLCLSCHSLDEFNEHKRHKGSTVRLPNLLFDADGNLIPPLKNGSDF